jgi:hypothetical protein
VKNEGGQEGGPSFSEGGSPVPLPGGKIRPSTRCGLALAVQLNEVGVVLAGVDDPQFPVLFARNGERNLLGDENRGDRELLRMGGLKPPSSTAAMNKGSRSM